MGDSSFDVGQLGLFFIMVFLLPGFVFLSFFILLFPNEFKTALSLTGFGELFSIIWFAILSGVTITPFCMTIEKILKDNIKSMNKTYPPLRLRRIALLEMQGKSSFFLNQIVSQGLMHMYICISSIIVIIIYVLNSIYYNYYKHSMFNADFILLCILLVILSNAYYAKHIFEVSMNTLNTLEDKSSDERIEIQ